MNRYKITALRDVDVCAFTWLPPAPGTSGASREKTECAFSLREGESRDDIAHLVDANAPPLRLYARRIDLPARLGSAIFDRDLLLIERVE